jgi:uncharacterized membrane protein YedE/YeeE
MAIVFALIAGLMFGFGLALSQMIDPLKVIGFLDVAGNWDPSLAFVMGGALAVTIPGFLISKKMGKSFSGEALSWPKKSDIDRPLVVGAVLFGLGWGLVGYCPGPALLTPIFNPAEALWFVIPMLVGLYAANRLKQV